ncbi:nitrate- and nitrite sensing domain-containing protein [Aliiglaciecola sp. 3_MG-2023]|uniref:nitrate- and nitrite sensing domain-containing protein n=1 Tax=Aliiglaciecola sp. 3_MG-2023 TaxID=3062644 RepID=UPI0026E2E79F|nr:nitrate- and nitrite sensing domain-containing protein [Aliiglaciecola sp. 3_MG-2023]MDO6694149.1 nitrate- and nitrite sensing domain-containing protein [Aliiglaciecola sp. 3_MG-2023]
MIETFTIILTVLIFSLVFVRAYTRLTDRIRLIRALDVISQLKVLIGNLQRHRGLSAGYLNGNLRVEPLIVELRQKINIGILGLNKDEVFRKQSRWLSFIDHWPRLEKKCFELTSKDSFTQHTNLIENLLRLMEVAADDWKKTHKLPREILDLQCIWKELPMAVEFIGQARSIGMAAATSREINNKDRNKLKYLEQKIQEYSMTSFSLLAGLSNEESKRLIIDARNACKLFNETIKKELIAPEEINIDSDNYFMLASNTMEAMNSLLDNEIKRIKAYT